MEVLDRFRGCLIGSAAGDALGYPVEFMDEFAIEKQFGGNGIRSFIYNDGKAPISDDTQLMLFTVDGLLRVTGGGEEKTERYIQSVSNGYKDWYRTQREEYPLSGDTHSRLADFPEMYEVRSPGILSLSALRKGGDGSFDRPINDSSDSSGLVRVVPAGLIFDRSKEKELSVSTDDVIELAARIAALTQGNPLGFVPAAALAEIVSSLTFGLVSDIKTAVTSTMEKIRYHFGDDEDVNHFLKLIDKAIGLAESDLSDREAIPLLGEGWDADEAVAIAVFCSIRHSDDFEEGLIASVNHRGNSNSTGAVTGSILGAGLGYENIPDEFTKKLELRKMILEFAEVLFHRIQIA